MPVVRIQREQGSKKTEEHKPVNRIQAVTKGGLFADVKIVAAIVGGVVLLLLGLIGWSQGWFGGSAAAPAVAPSPAAGKAAPMDSGDESKLMGNKRNKGMGE
jgi:hypothetical protein